MNNKLTLTDAELIVEPLGLDKLWSLTGSITIPWEHVRGATHDPGMKHEPKGFRAPGLRSGQKLAGTFHADGGRQFWNISGYENAVVIELKDEHFDRLIVSLDNPAECVARINEKAQAE